MNRLNIGIECWTEGDHWYEITLGDGTKDVFLKEISGIVSSGPGGKTLYESLISFTTDDIIYGKVDGKIEATEGNYSASSNLGSLIIKAFDSPVNLPFTLSFFSGEKVREGKLKVLVESIGALDLELQFNIYWEL